MSDSKHAQRLAAELRRLRCDARSAENGLAVFVRLRRDDPAFGLRRRAVPTLVWLPDPGACDLYVWDEGARSCLPDLRLREVAARVRETLVEERHEPEGAER